MSEYWALSQDIGSEIESKIDGYRNNLRSLPLPDVWRNAFNAVNRALVHSGDILALGENGEYSGVYVNDYRSLTESKLNMVFAQSPKFDCKAVNTDFESQVSAELGNGLLEYYLRDKKLEKFIRKAITNAYQVYGKMYLIVEWDVNGGGEYGTNDETGSVIKEGDIAFRLAPPQLVACDYVAKSNEELEWHIVTRFVNKYELAAKYPQYADHIKSLNYEYMNEYYSLNPGLISHRPDNDTDLIAMNVLYHRPTNALPNGRLVEHVDGQVLIDTPFPYKKSPVLCITMNEIEDTIWAYTEAWDLLPLEKITNTMHSTITTNQSIWGVSSVIVPQGANINKTNLGGGAKVFDYKGNVEPKQFNVATSSPDTSNYADKIVNVKEKLLSVPSTRRGAPEASLKSGYSIALVSGMALENSLNVQVAYKDACTNAGELIISELQDFATVPRIAMIAGKSNHSYMKEFKGQDLDGITKVFVDLGSPLAASIAGRLELAQNYINMPPEWRDKWISIVNTGRVEHVVDESGSSELLLIQSENEYLQEGKPISAIIIENHDRHIEGHRKLLMNPEAKDNPQLVQSVLAHIQKHIDLKNSGNPMLDYAGNVQQPPLPPPGGQPPPMEQPLPPVNPIQQDMGNVELNALPQ